MGFSDMVFLHGADHAQLVVFGCFIDGIEAGAKLLQDGCRKIQYFPGDAEGGVLRGEGAVHAAAVDGRVGW